MRLLRYSGPLFVALGVTLSGCTPAGNNATKSTKSPAKSAALPADLQVLPGSAQVVLTVDGMS